VIAYFLLGLLLLGGTLLLLRWAVRAEPRDLLRALLWSFGVVGVLATVGLLWLGRYQFAWLALPALAALVQQGRRWLNTARLARRAAAAAGVGGQAQGGGGRGGDSGPQSAVTTAYLDMTLDHDTGAMDGTVRDGRYAGARLADLSLADLCELWREVQADPQSAAVLQAYLDRVHGESWRTRAGDESARGEDSGTGAMSAAEARAILEVPPDADSETIRAAYRRLMQKLHPDHGGSTYFATKLNEARRVLLGEDRA